jgi:DNA-binding transcriptional LysR family regulator
MNLRQLEALVWVARLKSFRAAAAQLNTTQPAISLRVQELERALDVRLFDRNRRRVSLTAEGREYLATAEQVVRMVSELRPRGVGAAATGGRVSLGISELIAHTWFARLIARMGERHPEVKIDATVDTTPALVRGLDAGEFDVVLAGAHKLTTTHPTLELGSRPFAWIEKPGAPIRRPLRPRDLQARRIITWAKGAAIHPSIERWFLQDGAYPIHRITCNTAVTMAVLAAAGLGVALLPPDLVERELADGALRIVPTEPAFEPVRYRAIYVPAPGSLGRIVAEAAAEVSTFAKPPRRRG